MQYLTGVGKSKCELFTEDGLQHFCQELAVPLRQGGSIQVSCQCRTLVHAHLLSVPAASGLVRILLQSLWGLSIFVAGRSTAQQDSERAQLSGIPSAVASRIQQNILSGGSRHQRHASGGADLQRQLLCDEGLAAN